MFPVVFRKCKRADIDHGAYRRDSARMEQLAARQPGFLAFKSCTAEDGEIVAPSEWSDEAWARAWGRLEEHAHVQSRLRAQYHADYTLLAGAGPRVRRFERSAW